MSDEKEEKQTIKDTQEVIPKKVKKISLRDQLKESEDKYLRKLAEVDNFRKRSFRDMQDARNLAKSQTVEEFLNIYDTFKMALQASNQESADFAMLMAGLDMIQNEFGRTFSNLGVEEVNVKEGEVFDPNFHNAVSKEYHNEFEEGVVIRQQRCGYKLGDKLIRAATLVVSQGKEEVKEDECREDN